MHFSVCALDAILQFPNSAATLTDHIQWATLPQPRSISHSPTSLSRLSIRETLSKMVQNISTVPEAWLFCNTINRLCCLLACPLMHPRGCLEDCTPQVAMLVVLLMMRAKTCRPYQYPESLQNSAVSGTWLDNMQQAAQRQTARLHGCQTPTLRTLWLSIKNGRAELPDSTASPPTDLTIMIWWICRHIGNTGARGSICRSSSQAFRACSITLSCSPCACETFAKRCRSRSSNSHMSKLPVTLDVSWMKKSSDCCRSVGLRARGHQHRYAR